MADVLAQLARFLRRHWPHAIALVGMFFVFTFLHEAAHALAVIAQGGEMLSFGILPDSDSLGHIRYAFPPDARFSPILISMAPYLFWLACMLAAIALAVARRGWSFRWGSSIFIWAYLAPWLDILLGAAVWALGGQSDFTDAFGPATTTHQGLVLTAGLAVALVGYPLHRRLYPPDARLDALPYSILVALLAGLFALGL